MTPDAPTDLYRSRARRYKGVSTGTLLICIGVVFLLNTTGRAGWSIWWELLRMWPVLLIAAGVRMIFAGTPFHFLSLAGPALMVAATAWVIVSYEDQPGWTDLSSADSLEISCPAAPGDEPARLRMDFAVGELSLLSLDPPAAREAPPAEQALPGQPQAFAGSLRYLGERPDALCTEEGGLRLGRSHAGHRIRLHFPFSRYESIWESRLTMKKPVRLEAELAAVTAVLDLRSFEIVRLDLEAVASDVTLRLGRPAGRVPIRIDGAITRLEISVPEGTCYSITRDRFLSILDADDLRGRRRKRVVSTSCPGGEGDESIPSYELGYDLPISSVRVRTES